MNIKSIRGILVVLSAALSAGTAAYVSNFHPVANVAGAVSTVVAVVAYLLQSPLLKQSDATSDTAAMSMRAPAPHLNGTPQAPASDALPQRAPTWRRDDSRGFATAGVMVLISVLCALGMFIFTACTAAQIATVNSVLNAVDKSCETAVLVSSQIPVGTPVGPVAADIALACDIADAHHERVVLDDQLVESAASLVELHEQRLVAILPVVALLLRLG